MTRLLASKDLTNRAANSGTIISFYVPAPAPRRPSNKQEAYSFTSTLDKGQLEEDNPGYHHLSCQTKN